MTNVKDFIVLDEVNNQFKVLKYQFKHLFEKPKTHSLDELVKVKLLEMEDESYSYDLQLVLKLADNTKYYIKLINKPTLKNSIKYFKAQNIALNIATCLEKAL
ncbi:MAG: hypothetical protein IKN74_05625 [Clostridia bacterium]|nr:hypothetical protein [Clostridia bacterium]